MIHEATVPMLRCRVDSEHLNSSVHYVPEPEFLAWQSEMEDQYGRRVLVDEASSWFAETSAVEGSVPDPNTLWPVAKVRFMPDPRDAGSARVQFLASDSLQARAAQLAGLDVIPGYFVSSVPFTAPVVEDFDERAAQQEELLAAIA